MNLETKFVQSISISGSKSYMNFEEYLVQRNNKGTREEGNKTNSSISCEEYFRFSRKKIR